MCYVKGLSIFDFGALKELQGSKMSKAELFKAIVKPQQLQTAVLLRDIVNSVVRQSHDQNTTMLQILTALGGGEFLNLLGFILIE